MSDVAQQQAEAIKELREVIEPVAAKYKSLDEKLNSLDGLDKEKFEKCNTALDAMEIKNQANTLEMEKSRNEAAELKEQVINLEKQVILTSKSSPINYKESEEFKSFNTFVQKWDKSLMTPDEIKYLRTDQGTEGGYLVPQVLAEDILKQIEEISNVRALSRVRNRAGVKTLNIPVRTTIPTANYEGEAEEATDSNATYGQETMTAHRQTVVTDTTRDILNFASFNMESEIAQDAITAYAQGEGRNFLTGNGVKKPQGILDATAGIRQITTAASVTVSMDDVIKLAGELKVGYNPVYFFNSKTLAALRTEKDNNGNYLWRIGGESQPSTINDLRYVIMQDMPNIAASSLSVGLGDFFRGYNILDSVMLELLRDDLTQAKKAKVLFTWHRWNDGRVVLSEAFKLLKTKV